MRLRGQTGSPLPITVVGEHWDYILMRNPKWIHQNNNPYSVSYNFKETWGSNTPQFFKKVRSGQLLPHQPFEQFEGSARADGGWNVGVNYNNGDVYRDVVYGPAPTGVSSVFRSKDYYRNVALNYNSDPYVQEAAARIYSGGWDALTFAAELNKTVDLFRNFVRRLINLASNLSTWNKIWLEGRYGWRTLYYDMKDIEEAIASLDEKRTRFSERAGKTFTDTHADHHITNFAVWRYEVDITTTTKVSLRGSVTADIEPPKIIFNPLLTGWELLRFSFVIDWVVNIGRMLESWSFLSISQKYYASGSILITESISATGKSTVSNISPSEGTATGSVWANASGDYTYALRAPSSVSTLPHFTLDLDNFKIMDLVALLIESLKRR